MKSKHNQILLSRVFLAVVIFITAATSFAFTSDPFKPKGIFERKDFVTLEIELDGRDNRRSRPLEIQRHPITFAQWEALASRLPQKNQKPWESCNSFLPKPPFEPDYAVFCISKDDANAFKNALNSEQSEYDYSLLISEDLINLGNLARGAMLYEATRLNTSLVNIVGKYAWHENNIPDKGQKHLRVCGKAEIFGLCDIINSTEIGTIFLRDEGSQVSTVFRYHGDDMDAEFETQVFALAADKRLPETRFRLQRRKRGAD